MVTNLPPEAKEKWDEVSSTRNPEERLRLMGEFLSLVPKHKGTERMCSQVKKQMAALREEIEEKKQSKRGGRSGFLVPKAGAAQIAVVGPTNAGRSSLLRAVTNAQPEVTPYPYGTRLPVPGMLDYEDIQIQLVEVPPLVPGSSEGRFDGYQALSAVRNADGVLIVVDLRDDPVGGFLMAADELAKSRILLAPPEGEVEVTKRGSGGAIQFVWEGELADCSTEDVVVLLGEYRIRSALVRVRGRVTLQDVEDALFGNVAYRPAMVLANKADLGVDPGELERLRQASDPLRLIVASAANPGDLRRELGESLFRMLNLARIYTKEPGREPHLTPIIARGGVTVGELARLIHNDFYANFKYARIWGPAAKFPAEKVGLDRRLLDGTIIQIHV